MQIYFVAPGNKLNSYLLISPNIYRYIIILQKQKEKKSSK